jgi:CheY-like chemotaxis protein
MRVLLIEDDSATAQSIELMLKSESFNVYTTDLGEEGVDLGKLYDYDIILLDLNLPDMSGFEVLRSLRVSKVKTPILLTHGAVDTNVPPGESESFYTALKLVGAPVELLTLSACQTATGDEASRAALGLGGIALKAGAHSALATLWYVDERASVELICRFYAELRENPSRGKAYALQQAQRMLLSDHRFERFRHPCYWSPYLLIGEWR